MFSTIMVPVDLAHLDQTGKALVAATEMAKGQAAQICYVGVTSPEPGSVAHNPEEFSAKVAEFATAEAAAHGLRADHRAVVSHDPTADLGPTLVATAAEIGADLVVMATHVPGFPDHFFTANGAYVASHAPISVLLVR